MVSLKRFVLTFTTLTFLSCAHHGGDTPQKNLFFITGAHLDETSWSPVINNMDTSAYSMYAFPRLGRDADHPEHLKQIAEMACEKMKPSSIVIAHSFGGAIANEIVGSCPTKVEKIIYVSALVPLNQEHPTDLLKGADQTQYMSAVTVGKDRIIPKAKTEFAKALDAEFRGNESQIPNVFAESMLNYGDVIAFDPTVFSKIPKFYIYTNQDKIISLESQNKFTARLQLKGSEILKTGHLPMLSDPEQLARAISKLAKKSVNSATEMY